MLTQRCRRVNDVFQVVEQMLALLSCCESEIVLLGMDLLFKKAIPTKSSGNQAAEGWQRLCMPLAGGLLCLWEVCHFPSACAEQRMMRQFMRNGKWVDSRLCAVWSALLVC
jgi:hypothetical protein